MSTVIEAHGLSRSFDDLEAVKGVDLELGSGAVLGVIGPNGAGKTTLLRSLLGLGSCEGQLSVLGLDPRRQQARLMEQVCFIADTAVLPRWMKVDQLLDYLAGVHPRFDLEQARMFLAATDVRLQGKVRDLSKGMTVQLHLAIVMAIDASLLVLDEPTLGLDILFRKRFYEQLLNDYFDEERTIIISTHQVEEIEHILTEVLFMNRGEVVMHREMSSIEQEYTELQVVGEATARALAIPHIGERTLLGGKAIIYEGVDRSLLSQLGEVRTPSLSDLFVAKVGG